MVPGERFRAGPFQRWLYGDNYRDLWNTPIEVAVLDLDSVGGGLTPLRTGGDGQSISLHFTGADGDRYAVRSLDKDTTKSAFVGGPGRVGLRQGEGPVRGLHRNRFAGDASLYANVELRLAVAEVKLLVPGELGLFGAADMGRVFHPGDPDDADEWHNGNGGGLWLSFLERSTTLNVAVMKGRDLTGVYFRAGHMF